MNLINKDFTYCVSKVSEWPKSNKKKQDQRIIARICNYTAKALELHAFELTHPDVHIYKYIPSGVEYITSKRMHS